MQVFDGFKMSDYVQLDRGLSRYLCVVKFQYMEWAFGGSDGEKMKGKAETKELIHIQRQ